jgi:uncharacterized membrane protein
LLIKPVIYFFHERLWYKFIKIKKWFEVVFIV